MVINARGGRDAPTQRDVVVDLDRDILRFLDVVDVLEDGQPVSDTGNTHRFEIIV